MIEIKNKIIIFINVLFIILVLSVFFLSIDTGEYIKIFQKETNKEYFEINTTSKDIIKTLKNSKLSIGQIVYITEENDPNNLLNRPKGYIDKAMFEIVGITQNEFEELPQGGTIEIFKTKKEAEKRKSYLESFEGMLSVNQWIFLNENMLLRIDYEIKKSDAEKWEEVFKRIK